MAYVERDGCRIRYELRGDGPPLVLLNYACMSLDGWNREFLSALGGGRSLLLVEHRGAGLTEDGGKTYDAATLADDACAALDAVGANSADLLGVGLGAAVAQTLALDAPARIRRVVLISASCGPLIAAPSQPWVSWSLDWDFDANREANIRKALRAYFSSSYLERHRDELVDRVGAGLGGFAPATLERHWRVLRNFDSYDRLPALKSPCLIIHGEDDAIYPAVNAHLICDRLPDGRVIIIPDAGHAVTSERPLETARWVNAFLDAAIQVGGEAD